MFDGAIITQGNFISTGLNTTLVIPQSVDWIKVYNLTNAGAVGIAGPGKGTEWYFQRNMTQGSAIEWFKTNGTDVLNQTVVTQNGFTLVDGPVPLFGAANATITAISPAAVPVVSATFAAGSIKDGDVIRLFGRVGTVLSGNIGGSPQLGAIDFTIGSVNFGAQTFTLANAAQLAVAGTTAAFKQLNVVPPYPMFKPSVQVITKMISAGLNTLVTLAVTHTLAVGQRVAFRTNLATGMVEINNLYGTIVAINTTDGNSTNTITVDIDSSSFTLYAFPLAAAIPFTPGEVVPAGEQTQSNPPMGPALSSPNLLDDSTFNQGFLGIILGAGNVGPAGVADDEIFWVAGKSYGVNIYL